MAKKIPQDQIRAIKAKENSSGLIKRIGKENSSGLIKRAVIKEEKVKEEKVKENSSGLIKRAGIIKEDTNDILDITTNRDNSLQEFPKKNFKMWVVKAADGPDSSEKVAGSDTIVRSQHYGQAVDDYIINWNKRKRMGKTIGYPIVQGKAVSEDEM